MLKDTSHRRRFLGGMMAAAAAAVGAPLACAAPGTGSAPQASQDDDWLSEVQGTSRCLFDFSQHKNGFPLLHIHNFIATYESGYGIPAADVGTVGTFYGIGGASSIAMGFDDATWEKYQLGEYLGLSDRSGNPYTRNVFRAPTADDGHLFTQAVQLPPNTPIEGAIANCGIENLQSRGTKFLMCNNALGAWTVELAARGKGEQAALDADLRAHLLPGVTIVPAMVVAIQQAQTAGIAYNKQ
jgi:intracellular sulfur oxidation DsrE/DsrF family protein